ncbi:hypothetical protein AnigIFM50267_010621 [Aspergillus niger]|nr:hypothetical protein AnigIFM50267_010621 [Aspergillus niger]
MKVTGFSAVLALSLTAQALASEFVGCYSSSGSLVNKGSSQFQSTGLCSSICGRNGASYAATSNSMDCYCGSLLPPSANLVSKSECDVPCPGFPSDFCGGDGFWSVHKTYIGGDDDDGDSSDDGNGDSPSGDNSGDGPDDGPGSGPGNGPDGGPGQGPGGGPETTTASSITIYPTSSAVITVTSDSAVTGTSSPSATVPSKESSSVSVATASPTTATSGASRRFRFLFF